jgi:hypothetical protein
MAFVIPVVAIFKVTRAEEFFSRDTIIDEGRVEVDQAQAALIAKLLPERDIDAVQVSVLYVQLPGIYAYAQFDAMRIAQFVELLHMFLRQQ